ncbi:MAG: hypothetical protein DMF61_12890 [Blastocatellia bacterium AA13]|nr:MAG: hypothetical protein DMF61_12890 [Blastocatellia bacterium AA13]
MIISKSGLTALMMITLCAGVAGAAHQDEENDPAKAAAVIQNAIKARGGDSYLKIKSIVSRGEYTPFVKGVSSLPDSFVDYIVYPDHERTEFGKGGHKMIQTNSGDTGWIYDAAQKMIRDQKEDQVKRWQQGIRYDLDNLLRRGWREQGAKLVYLGRREPWKNTFSEAVRIDFADGGSATLHFDARTKLPLMNEYKLVGEEGRTSEQVRYYQWNDIAGVMFPRIQDSYSEGKQTTRTYFESVSPTEQISDKLFAKPAGVKDVK